MLFFFYVAEALGLYTMKRVPNGSSRESKDISVCSAEIIREEYTIEIFG